MSIQVKFRRGSANQHNSFTGANGEITVDTTNKTLRVHDGVTVGGTRLAKFSELSSAVNVSSYLQVANANAKFATKAYAAANSYVISVYNGLQSQINNRLEVANAAATYQTKTIERQALANTNSYIATKASWVALTGTNTSLRTLISDRLQVANADAKFTTKAYAAANTYVKLILANTNLYIATKITNAVSTTLQTRSIIPSSNVMYDIGSATKRFNKIWLAGNTIVLGSANLSATNTGGLIVTGVGGKSYSISTDAIIAGLYITNTAARTLISDRLQVTNANAKFTTKAYAAANAYLNANFLKKTNGSNSSQTIQGNILFSANVAIQGRLQVTGGITSYFANNVSTGDNMIYLNANSDISNPDIGLAANYNDGTYHHTGFFRDASDGGTWKVFENYLPEPDANVYINTAHASFRLAPFSARNARFTGILSVTGNTTLGNTTLSNTTVGGFLKLNGTDIRATFAQNTSVRLAISDRLQVSNAASIYQTKTVERQALANTNSYIATKAPWSGITGTNTALRALISDRLQVANAKTYLQVANAKNYLQVSNVQNYLQVANAKNYLQVANSKNYLQVANSKNYLQVANSKTYLQVANAISIYATKVNPTTSGLIQHTGRMTISDNIDISGNTKIYKLLANNSLGTAGYALKTNGTSVYWDAVGSGGGSSNSFTGILVGSNVVVADSSTDRLTFVAGAGMTISANPSTDTIIFASTATGGGSLITTTTKTLDALKGTDTIVTGVSGTSATAYLQVANAAFTYAVKSNPQTSGLLAHTGRATISTNLSVTGNTTVSTHIITPNRHACRVYGSGTTNNLTTTQNGDGKLNNNNFAVDYNQGNCLHANTGVFTARVAGLYQICQNVRNSGYSSGISQLICYKNKGVAGEAVMIMTEFASSSTMNHAGGSTVASLAAGDTLSIRVGAGQINFDGNDNWSVTHLG